RADERARNALFRAAAEVALWLADDDVVANLRGACAVQMRGAGRRVAARVAMNGQLLRIRISRRRVAVVEHHLEVAVGAHDGIRTLVEIAGVRVLSRVDEISEKAERRRDAADLFGRGKVDAVIGRHRPENWRS